MEPLSHLNELGGFLRVSSLFDLRSGEVMSDAMSGAIIRWSFPPCRRWLLSFSSLDTISIYGIQKVDFRYWPSSLFISPNRGALLWRCISRALRTARSKCLCSVFSIAVSSNEGPTEHVLACSAAPDRSHCSLATYSLC